MKKTLSILLVTVATLTMAACGNTTTEKATTQSSTETSQKASTETTYPFTVKTYDAKGNEVEQVFDKAPEKVITNNLSTTEILLELGLKDKIAGMLNPDNAVTDKYKDAIATIPQIGDKKTVSQETVLSYEPDAVMGRNMMFSEKSLGTVSTWNENKIPVYTQKASLSTIQQDLGNIVEDVKNLGMIFNVQDKANEYATQLQAKIDAVKKVTLENLVSMDPELIIYVTSDRNKKLDANAVELMKANEVLENVPAIKNQKIMTISYDELMDYGPAVIDSLEKINDFINK